MSEVIELYINEENSISFQIAIEGSSSEMGTKPEARFVIEDPESGIGFTFPTEREGDDLTVVTPSMDKFLTHDEDKFYNGRLEVLIGSRIFIPKEFEIKFVKPLKVEAASVVVNRKKSTLSESQTSEPTVKATVKKTVKKEVKKPTKEETKAVLEKEKAAKLQEQKERRAKDKDNLKKMLSSALKDIK